MVMNKKIFYILPSYNEALNLNILLSKFKRFFKKKNINVLIIIVDDGSIDNSIDIIKRFIQKNNTKKEHKWPRTNRHIGAKC